MYAHIEGVVCEKTADSIVLDANGVGYLLMVSGATLSVAPAAGERMKLYCVLNVREDAMELFGFYSREEKHMYQRLRGVSGVGSRTALQILSSMSVRDLSLALVTGDSAALCRVPGIGKKTAQRIALELKEQITSDEVEGLSTREGGPVIVPQQNDPVTEAMIALQSLGYTQGEAMQALSAVKDKSDQPDELVRLALRGMM